MPRGGVREGSGRKKGQPNKRTAELLQAVSESGLTPLEYMLTVMRDKTQEWARRDDMAKAAAPYVHSKLASVEHSGKIDMGLGDRLSGAIQRVDEDQPVVETQH
jgi:hypothetical protein